VEKQITLLRGREVPRKNSVGHADSVEKIIAQISLLSPDEVRYQPTTPQGRILRERVYDTRVREVLLTPSLFRQFICTAGCTACCQKFTLDYTPSEFLTVEDQTGFEKRTVWVNGKEKWVWTNDQNQNPICDFLTVKRPDGGLGCAHYPHAPLSCMSAPQLQFIQMRPERTFILKKPFGRAWAMTPSPQCQFLPLGPNGVSEIQMMIDLLDRFGEWARYFGIKTCIYLVRRELRKIQQSGAYPTETVVVWAEQPTTSQ
jgi:hypothetical protein